MLLPLELPASSRLLHIHHGVIPGAEIPDDGAFFKSPGVHGIHVPRGAAARFRTTRVHPFPLGSFSK
jgi:hypothetical protein